MTQLSLFKKISLGLTIAFSTLFLTTFAFAYSDKLTSEIRHLITNYSYKVNQPIPTDMTIDEMMKLVAEKDKHSYFVDANDPVNDHLKTTYFGVGIMIEDTDPENPDNNYLRIKRVFQGPAKNILLKDDIILAVDGEDIKSLSMQDSITKIKGVKGTYVILRIKRGEDILTFSIARGDIVKETVFGYVNEKYAYIRVVEFNSKVADRVAELLYYNYDPETMVGVILDLRYNLGGQLIEAAKMVDIFIDEGVIVETRSKSGSVLDTLGATPYPFNANAIGKVVILVNEYSASASEIVAAALKDYNRAVLVGVKTYGKGSVQTIFPLKDTDEDNKKYFLKFTTAKYFTKGNYVIDGNGILPDVNIELIDSPTFYLDEIDYEQYDNQLKAAIKILVE